MSQTVLGEKNPFDAAQKFSLKNPLPRSESGAQFGDAPSNNDLRRLHVRGFFGEKDSSV
jgi:hypothetical protein